MAYTSKQLEAMVNYFIRLHRNGDLFSECDQPVFGELMLHLECLAKRALEAIEGVDGLLF